MNPITAVEDFLLHKALGRAVVMVANAAASYYAAHSGLAQSFGISASVDPNVLAAGIMGAGATALQWLGTKIAPHFPKLGAALGAHVITSPLDATPLPK